MAVFAIVVKMRLYFMIIIAAFLCGWLASNAYSTGLLHSLGNSEEKSLKAYLASEIRAKEKASPKDRIKESQIHVYNNRVVLDIKNAEWSTFTDTNSMDPVLDYGANAIHIIPKSEDEIQPGDIVAYESRLAEGTIIHRVKGIGYDSQGKYFIMKGDNNKNIDPEKVRFSQIKRVLVAIIY